MDRTKLLDKTAGNGEERMLLSRVLDKWEQSQKRSIPVATGFLSPAEQALAVSLLQQIAQENSYVFWGGYDDAERRQLWFLPDWCEEPTEGAIGAIRAEFYETGKLTHRDFLGSLMGMGITRESVGDILVSENSADILVSEGIRDYLLQNWTGAGRSALKLTEIPLNYLHLPEEKTKTIRDTVPSLRLDSVIASGFGLSRAKAAEAVNQGKVQLNWTECRKSDKIVNESDILSVRGLGKCRVEAIGNETKKGRIFVTLKRYL